MEQWVENLFSKEVLNEAALRYKADASNAKKLGDFENYVYEVERDGKGYILRLTHSSHRLKEEVEGELKWINFLNGRGIHVSLVHESVNGELVEVVPVSDSNFYVCLFDKAPGSSVQMNSPEFGPELFEKWGATTARLHLATEEYDATETQRLRWDEDDLIELDNYIDPVEDKAIVEGNRQLVVSLQQLPQTKETFGLIHSDIHQGNFFYHEGDIHIFDFDDTMYFYFASDIAIPLYYSIWQKYRKETLETRSTVGKEILTHFLRGYMSVRGISREWVERLPMFLNLRDYTLYGVINKKFDLSAKENKIEKQLAAEIRERLIQNEPIVDLDYGAIWEQSLGR
ncbi:Ser/Thr protein kinase RdoA (MazF antagonist) [Paenibacillus castaneae]|uniref:phosphotransferase enzyme family protein n=1 Tax=Paenibacillus castaneae TaxID=474957 RepID=UPI000C9BF6EE|nr:phosphotransferase [Paenibacillus castaneae]NIK76530.1 Ser/Thr protein kinase RdoA (MazF antagonist) [Paenibacillus castaneae]